MAWFNVWTGLKNKTCRYLLQRYLGQFLEEKLNLEQLKVDLYNGKATVRDVSLKVEAINELFEAQGWGLEAIDGHIGLLTVTVPWNALMTNDSSIEVSDVFISLRPVRRQNDGTSMLESMWSSVSSSMQLAEECMRQKDDEGSEDTMEINTNSIVGLAKFAETIDNVLNRIKATFTNITLRLEYPSNDGSRTIALYINIADLTYKNETGCEKYLKKVRADEHIEKEERSSQRKSDEDSYESIYLMPMFAKHNVNLAGLRVFTEEYTFENNLFRTDKPRNLRESGIRIPILESMEQQKIQIKMKQSENIIGPKVWLVAEIGAIYLFLTPRQTHLLLEFWNAFQEEDLVSRLNCRKSEKNVPCEKSHVSGITVKPGNWNNVEDITAPITASKNLHSGFDGGNSSLYCDSLSSSVSSGSTLTASSKLHRKMPSIESCGEILNFSIKITSFVGAVLHEDILVETNTNMSIKKLNENSQNDLIHLANTFFACAQNMGEEITNKSFIKNHLCLRISPLFVEGVQQRNKNVLSCSTKIIANNFDLSEILDGMASALIVFDHTESLCAEYPKRPDVTINTKSTSSSKFRDVFTSFEMTLEKCTLELDISMYDRLSYILGPSPFSDFVSFNAHSKEPFSNSSVEQDLSLKSSVDVNMSSIICGVKIRFPIVDARPIHDPKRVPWWKKNVRADFLFISFNQFCVKYVPTKVDITANEISLFYCEKDVDTKILLLKTYLERQEESNAANPRFRYPQVLISVPSNQNLTRLPKHYSNESDHPKTFEQCSLPFSSKRVCRESDTIHNKRDKAESETIFLPGDTEEVSQFCDLTMKASKVQIHIYLPVVEVMIESKHLYEIIYNRLNADVFMWEPNSPVFQKASHQTSEMKLPFLNLGLMDSMYVKSESLSDSHEEKSNADEYAQQTIDMKVYGPLLSDSEDSDESTKYTKGRGADSIYLSTHDNEQSDDDVKNPVLSPSDCSIEILIGRGSLEFFVPVRDLENRVLPGQFGKFDFKVNSLKIFSVNGYNGSKTLSYLCLQLSDVEMYHCGIVSGNSSIKSDYVHENIAHFMQSTLYKIPKGLTKGTGTGFAEREMVSLIIEIKKNPDQRIKRLKITTGIQQTALRYHPALSDQFWLNQLIDFLDVLDFPIEGYEPFGVITEIQLHLWDCAIDYRPKNIGFRAVIELGSFTIGSNIISSVAGCNLRLIVEECILSLAPFDNSNNVIPDYEISSIDSKYLVPVLDIGLLDISLRLTGDKISDKCPRFDLRCSVQEAHLRTCSDSGSALAQLISYIANDGDFTADNSNEAYTISSETSVHSETEIVSTTDDKLCSDISEKQQERVNYLMAQAVQDTVKSNDFSPNLYVEPKYTNRGIEVFYFPDEDSKNVTEPQLDDNTMTNEMSEMLNFESNVMSASFSAREDTLPQVKVDLGDVKEKRSNKNPQCSREDEYCIIPDNEKYFMSQFGIKNMEISNEPLRIVDNHFFLPTDKPDLLKSPDNFPLAVSRYTLCEMTFTWHLYGGKDFFDNTPISADTKGKMENSRMSDAYKHGVSNSTGLQSNQFGKKPKEHLTWKSKGGPQRNHEVLVEMQFSKVRVSHEVYPVHTLHASRQVLLINEIEIRDRLQTSDINKFLYYPNMRNLSNKSSQHMVVIKALHVRPNPDRSLAQECSLRISLLPMRLHIDQDTLLFLADYFTNIGENSTENCCPQNDYKLSKLNSGQQAPVMTVEEIPEAVQDLNARKIVSTNIDLLMDKGVNDSAYIPSDSTQARDDTSPIYFREVIFSPEVRIRFDYHGRRVELSRGPIAGLLMGLGQLQCSEIRLRKIVYRRGLLGVDKLLTFLCKVWLKDIKRNQLPKILSGVGPAYALVQFFQGIYDLFWLPIEQYQKDGRIFRGLQLGAQSFSARTALAALEITSRIIQLLQITAETAFDMVSPGPPVRRIRKMQEGKKKRLQRPKDIREGVTNAYLIFKEGINDSANTLIETAVAEHDQKGYTGAVGAVIRHIPPIICQPAVWTTQATTNILGGVKSSLVPEAKMEAREKWKDESD